MKHEDIDKVAAYLESLVEKKFYGRVILGFQNGQVDTIKTETLQRIEHLDAAQPETRPRPG